MEKLEFVKPKIYDLGLTTSGVCGPGGNAWTAI
jgi:hypothetical protein